MIQDEFKNRNLSRQRKYQLRKRKQGKCPICGQPSGENVLCVNHLIKNDLIKDSYTTSNSERDFLNYFLIPLRQIIICNMRVDGLKDNVIYEFLGDYWHGNPSLFDPKDVNLRAKKPFGELYKETFERFEKLKKANYIVKYVWERDWKQFQKKKVSELKLNEV
jgi:hypothetical protein